MTSRTLQMIAEVKMHLRDSHAVSWNQKQQSHPKRHFGLPPPSIRNSESSLPGTPCHHLPPRGKMLRRRTIYTRSVYGTSIPLQMMIQTSILVSESHRPMFRLFDFTSNHWVKEHNEKCSRSLNEGLNFYELPSDHDVDAARVEESQFCDYR